MDLTSCKERDVTGLGVYLDLKYQVAPFFIFGVSFAFDS